MAGLIPSQLKMFLPMLIMWLYNKYGTDLSLDHIRIAYGTSQAFALLLQLYVHSRVQATASTTQTVTVKTKPAQGPETTEELTVKEYDSKQCFEGIQRVVLGALFIVVLHTWKGFLQPLVIQSAMTFITMWDEPLVQIYLLGERAEGKLKRPFKKDAGPLAALLNPEKPEEPAEAVAATAAADTSAAEPKDTKKSK